ncbi:unnamed protein product, partial [Ixodes pacificus]
MPRGGKCAVPSPAQGGPRIPLSHQSDVLGSGRVSHAPEFFRPLSVPWASRVPILAGGRRPSGLRFARPFSLTW